MTNNVRKLRLDRSMSQRDLAKAAGVTHATVVNVEQGHHLPHVQTLMKLAAVLDTTLDGLLTKEPVA